MPTEFTDPALVPVVGSATSAAVPVANESARLALTLQAAAGKTVIQQDDDSAWMLVSGGDPAVAEDWLQVGSATDAILRTAAQGDPNSGVTDNLVVSGTLVPDATGTLIRVADYHGWPAWTNDGLDVEAALETGRTIMRRNQFNNYWYLTKYSDTSIATVYSARSPVVADSPVGLTGWIPNPGSGDPTVAAAPGSPIPAAYLGQKCLVGDTPATREIYIALGTGGSTVWAKVPRANEVPHL